MTDQQDDPLAHFGLDAIDLRWTLKDIASKRTLVINKDHLPKLIELGLVEMREGAPMRFTTQLLARDAKKVHLFHEMFHGEQGYLAATNETIVMNIDYATRRSAPWPAPVAVRLEELWQTHRDLPKPAKAGRVMGLSRKK